MSSNWLGLRETWDDDADYLDEVGDVDSDVGLAAAIDDPLADDDDPLVDDDDLLADPVEPQPHRIAMVHPTTLHEARAMGEYVRAGIPAVVDLTGMSGADARRVVDFASGVVFSLHGSIDRVADRVFLLLPAGVILHRGGPDGFREDADG